MTEQGEKEEPYLKPEHTPYLMEADERSNQVKPPYLFFAIIAVLIVWLIWHNVTYDEAVVREAYERQEAATQENLKNISSGSGMLSGN